MNELVKKSFKATPIIVRVVYRVFCIIYRPNKNLKKNAFGVASDVYSIYGVLSDSKNNQINENDIEETKNIIDSSVTTSISPNSNEIFTNQEIGPNSGSSSFLMDTNKTQSTLEKGEKKVKSIFGFLAKGFLFLYVLFSLFLCLPSNHSDDVIVNEGGKTESITELSESKNTLSEKETLDNKSPILSSANAPEAEKLSNVSENKEEPVWLDEKETTQSSSTSDLMDKKEINHKNLIREQIF